MFPAAFPREIGPLHLLHQKALCVPPTDQTLHSPWVPQGGPGYPNARSWEPQGKVLGAPRWSWAPQGEVLGAPR